ncbi:MAG: ABC transporter ATP-binding protein [Caldilineaceae bacterium]|nr:ABC transporter ATP-binding protein [Caldilineaceae bacterium]
MANPEKRQGDALPSVEKGVGGAGRIQGLLTDEKAADSKETLSRLLSTIRPFRVVFIVAIILTLIGTISQVIAPRLVGSMITTITRTITDRVPVPWESILRTMIILAVLYMVNFAATYAATTSMVRLTQKVVASLRQQIDVKLNRVPLNYFDTSSAGNVSSLLSNDLDNVSNTLQSGLTSSITAVVMMVGVFIMMLTIHPLLTLVAVVIVPISSWVVKALVDRSKPIFRKNASTTGELNGQIEEAFQGKDVVRTYHLQDALKGQIKDLNDQLYETEWKSSYVSFMARPAGDLMLNIDYVLVSILGGWYVINGVIQIGEFQAFVSYTKMFTSPFQQVLGIMNTIMSALASAERIYNFLDESEIVEFGTAPLEPTTVQGDIAFEDVDFAYVPERPLFVNISLDIKQGQQIAIVGQTGAGKTTLVNLLMRFYEIQDGKILLDGTDTKSYATSELRKAFAMVLQDTWLFEGSIRDNIAYGAHLESGQTLADVSHAEIENAAEMARADSFIKRLPNGYETLLSEGAMNISQGQRQLLTIARAIIKHAPIIILDEATSSVDTRTELLIQHGMKVLTTNRTSFIIAHRLSTIRDADRILVMDKGSIVESGTHEELLGEEGLYSQMFHAGQAA